MKKEYRIQNTELRIKNLRRRKEEDDYDDDYDKVKETSSFSSDLQSISLQPEYLFDGGVQGNQFRYGKTNAMRFMHLVGRDLI